MHDDQTASNVAGLTKVLAEDSSKRVLFRKTITAIRHSSFVAA